MNKTISVSYKNKTIHVTLVKEKFTHNNRMVIKAFCDNTPFCVITSDIGYTGKEYIGHIHNTMCPKSLIIKLLEMGLIKNPCKQTESFVFTDKLIFDYCVESVQFLTSSIDNRLNVAISSDTNTDIITDSKDVMAEYLKTIYDNTYHKGAKLLRINYKEGNTHYVH